MTGANDGGRMMGKVKAQETAERVGAALVARSGASRALGIRLEEIRPGYARLSMTVTADMLNGVGICHGGFTYLLADDAFAFACNAHNRLAVAQAGCVTYPAAAREGDVLTAVCREIHRKGRSGTYDSTVTNQEGEVVALFRGNCRIIEGHIVEEND